MKKSKIIIPCYWNKEILKKIVQINKQSDSIKIKEIYGSLAKSPIGHGRSPSSVVNVGKDNALDFRNYTRTLGLDFIYLLNAPFSFKNCHEKDAAKNYLDWVINEFNPDALMIASYELMKFIRLNYSSNIRIYISTVAGVKNARQLEKYLDIKPTRVVPHHDVNRNYSDLEYLIQKAREWEIEIELMVTESCLRRCSSREAHYSHLGAGNSDEPFHTICNTKRIIHPSEILNSNFIRPEDLVFYEKMGINSFKITGRSKPAIWIYEVAEAYMKRSYSGNLLRLLGTDPSLELEKWIYLDNKALEKFLENFPKNGREKDENIYCEEIISRLYIEKKFRVEDGTKYSINSRSFLVCDVYGKNVLSLLSIENKKKI